MANYTIAYILFIVILIVTISEVYGDPCDSCKNPLPIVQPNNRNKSKCANINSSAIVSGHIMDYPEDGKCKKRFVCNGTWGMTAAYIISQSNCISSFASLYFECINSTWLIDIDDKPSEQIDQAFCYTNDENTCSESTPPPILGPGDTYKILSCPQDPLGNYNTVNTTANNVCGITINCSPPSGLMAHYIDRPTQCYYQYEEPNAGYYNGSWMMWTRFPGTETEDYYPIDQVYCFFDLSRKQPCSSCPQELPLVSSTTQCSLPGMISSSLYHVENTTKDDGVCRRRIVCDAPEARPFVHFTNSSCRYNANGDNTWQLNCYNGSWITNDKVDGWEAVDEVGCYMPYVPANTTMRTSTGQHSTELMTTLTAKSTTYISRTSSKIDKCIIIAAISIVLQLITIAIILYIWNRRKERFLWAFENVAMSQRRSMEMLEL